MEIPVLFRWMDDRQTACEGAGFCRDISTGGVFVIAFCAVPPLSHPLELMVLLPRLNPRAPAMRLCSSGSVVRVEPVGEATGLGIASAFGDFGDSKASSFPEDKISLPSS
ncbi:MAG TPA: PilZ domain-containing protein [Terriglobales bacterium]|nr:PilZ domain-containing protein [Terriglobales bacterium]